MQAHRRTEFSIYLDQRPGELAGLLAVFHEAGGDIQTLCITEHNGRGLARFLAAPAEPIRARLEPLADQGVGPIVEAEVLAIDLDASPSTLRNLSTRLAEQGINVRYGYLCPAQNGTGTLYIFRVDDLSEAEHALETMD
ncbi:MAG: hypothetical protein AAF235_02285 [Planctomycetota bacterium]